MKRTLIFLIVTFVATIEYAYADFPHYVRCPKITSEVEPTDKITMKAGFTFTSSRKNGSYPVSKFVGADLNKTYTFSCHYEASDGTRVTAKFDLSRCEASSGFDSSGKCNNSDPVQCMTVCAY
jgi:hypothetical protein